MRRKSEGGRSYEKECHEKSDGGHSGSVHGLFPGSLRRLPRPRGRPPPRTRAAARPQPRPRKRQKGHQKTRPPPNRTVQPGPPLPAAADDPARTLQHNPAIIGQGPAAHSSRRPLTYIVALLLTAYRRRWSLPSCQASSSSLTLSRYKIGLSRIN